MKEKIKKAFELLRKNWSTIAIVILTMVLIFFSSREMVNNFYSSGYKKGQIDSQRGILIYKVEDNQIWKLENE